MLPGVHLLAGAALANDQPGPMAPRKRRRAIYINQCLDAMTL